jgi:16S rRNA (cytosine967-C5)-methyltransferase
MSRRSNPRWVAVQVLLDVVVRERRLGAALAPVSQLLRDRRDVALTKELCFGVLRWWPRLEALQERLLERPLKHRDRDVEVILLLGLYQLLCLRVPAHAAVNETVALTSLSGKPWAKGLVNGVLRRFERERATLVREVDRRDSAALAHPDWLVKSLRRCWPEDWRQILTENNQRPPMTLRVNRQRRERDAYLADLAAAGLAGHPTPHAAQGVTLAEPVDVDVLPGFAQGQVSVQDAAAQLAAPLLAPAPGERVLDACAAPGGKTAHLLEYEPSLQGLVALDKDPERLARLHENLARLGLQAAAACADAAAPDRWWDGARFQRILLDAPCSATGIIRRHPDVKLLRRADQIAGLVSQQERLLVALWPLLAPGGTLLYATCSVLCEENDAQIARFVASRRGVDVQPIEASWGRALRYGRQVLPGEEEMDGFYYALLRKG